MNNRHILFTIAVLTSIVLLVHIIPSAEAGNSEARKQAKAQSEAIKKGANANADLRGSSSGNKASGDKPIYGCVGTGCLSGTTVQPPVKSSSGKNTGDKPVYGCVGTGCLSGAASKSPVKSNPEKCNSNYGWLSVSLPNRWHQALIWIDGQYVGNKQANVQVLAGYHNVYVQYFSSSGFSYDETTRGYVPACKSWSINSS